jgi:hypothetical protein
MKREGSSLEKHPRLAEIIAALDAKRSYRAISEAFSVSLAALSRYVNRERGQLGGATAGANSLAAIDRLIQDVTALRHRGRRQRDPKLTLAASRELRALVELRARLAARQPLATPEPAADLDDATLAAMAETLARKRTIQ